MKYVVFTGGEFSASRRSKQAIEQADAIIAADSGANTAVKLNIFPSIVIGDLDSIDEQTKVKLKKHGSQFITSASEKDETDTELALNYAIKQGATTTTVLGGTSGDRLDHILANILLSTKYTVPISFVNGHQISWVARGPTKQTIAGKTGDLLSLLPIAADVKGMTTKGLYYPLNNETLLFGKPRGVSNVFTEETVTVSFQEGTLFFIHTTHDVEG